MLTESQPLLCETASRSPSGLKDIVSTPLLPLLSPNPDIAPKLDQEVVSNAVIPLDSDRLAIIAVPPPSETSIS